MKTSPPAAKAVVEMTGGRIWVPNKGKPKMGCFGRSGRTLRPRCQAEITAHVGAGRGCWLCPLHPRCQAALRQPFSARHVDCQVNTLRAENKCDGGGGTAASAGRRARAPDTSICPCCCEVSRAYPEMWFVSSAFVVHTREKPDALQVVDQNIAPVVCPQSGLKQTTNPLQNPLQSPPALGPSL